MTRSHKGLEIWGDLFESPGISFNEQVSKRVRTIDRAEFMDKLNHPKIFDELQAKYIALLNGFILPSGAVNTVETGD